MKKIIPFIIISFFILSGCQERLEKKAEQEVVPVKVERVELKELALVLEYIGNIRGAEEAIMYPKVSGKIIEKTKDDGDSVSKGDAIVYIDRDEVGLKYERAPVESTLNGRVGRVYVDIGENVSPETAIALVVDMDRVKVDVDIPEKYISRISLGQSAQISVDAYSDAEFSGRVTMISPVVDITTRNAPIEITVDNPEHLLKSGMFAKVNLFLNERKSSPAIRKEAVIGKEPEVYVYVAKDNRAVLRKIKLGIRQGPWYEVQEGLKEGELVVVMGQQRLTEGVELSVEGGRE